MFWGLISPIKGYSQLRIAETEKYAHVTFFFDGTVNYDGVEKPAWQIHGAS
jgi:bisphosphoglycerate-independent phosphoglycerate mutase (AlkP superfamily)